MESLIEQVKNRVNELYAKVVEELKSDKLCVLVYGLNDELLFRLEGENLTFSRVNPWVVQLLIEVSHEILEEFCIKHGDEQPHFIHRFEIWNDEEHLLINNFYAKEPHAILDSTTAYSVTYRFTSKYVEDH